MSEREHAPPRNSIERLADFARRILAVPKDEVGRKPTPRAKPRRKSAQKPRPS